MTSPAFAPTKDDRFAFGGLVGQRRQQRRLRELFLGVAIDRNELVRQPVDVDVAPLVVEG